MTLDKSNKKLVPIVDSNNRKTARWKNISDRSDDFNKAVVDAASLGPIAVQLDLTDENEEPQVSIRPEHLGDLTGVSQSTLDEYGLGALNPRQVDVLAAEGMTIDEALDIAEKPVQRFDQKQTTSILKSALQEQYPNTKFSVTGSRGTGSSYLNVKWTGGPPVDQVEAVASQYQNTHSRGWADTDMFVDATVAKIDGEWTPARFSNKGTTGLRNADFAEIRAIEATLGEPNTQHDPNGGFQHCGGCGNRLERGNDTYYSFDHNLYSEQCGKSCHAMALEAAGATARELGGDAPAPAEPSSFKTIKAMKEAAQPGTRITVTQQFVPGKDQSEMTSWSGEIVRTNSTGIWVKEDEDHLPYNPMRQLKPRRIDWPAGTDIRLEGGKNTFQDVSRRRQSSFTIGGPEQT